MFDDKICKIYTIFATAPEIHILVAGYEKAVPTNQLIT